MKITKILLILFVFFALSVDPSFAAVSIDASSGVDTWPVTTVTTHSHTTAGSNRLLLVGAYFGGAGGVSSVTYGGQSMTLLKSYVSGTDYTVIYYLVAPPVGANNVVFTTVSSTNPQLRALSFNGVDQSTPFEGDTSYSASCSSCTITVVSTAVDSWAIGYVRNTSANMTSRGTTVILDPVSAGNGNFIRSASTIGAVSNNLEWTQTGGGLVYSVGAVISPVGNIPIVSSTSTTPMSHDEYLFVIMIFIVLLSTPFWRFLFSWGK